MKIEHPICDKCRQTIGFEIKYLRLFEKIHEKIEHFDGLWIEQSRCKKQISQVLKSLLEEQKDVL